MHSIVVLKFGGTSVSSLKNWQVIKKKLEERNAQNTTPFVVCSALSSISNLLEKSLTEVLSGIHAETIAKIKTHHLDFCHEMQFSRDEAHKILFPHFLVLDRCLLGANLLCEVSPKVKALIMAQGELMLTKIAAAWLKKLSLAVQFLDARLYLRSQTPKSFALRHYLSSQVDGSYDQELVTWTENTIKSMPKNETKVFITQGFIASNDEDETVLLGRGGSDTSAAYFGAKLGATRVEIWTDVPGMFTGNPQRLPHARVLHHLNYEEAQEMASAGSKVLHPRCLEPLKLPKIPLEVHSTFHPNCGEFTLIDGHDSKPPHRIKAVSSKSSVFLVSMESLSMWQEVGFLSKAFDVFQDNGISIDLIATSERNVTVSIDSSSNLLTEDRWTQLLRELSSHCRPQKLGPLSQISIIGTSMRSLFSHLVQHLDILENHKTYLVSQSASDLNFSFIVDPDSAGTIEEKLHKAFFSDSSRDEFGSSWSEIIHGTQSRTNPIQETWWHKKRSTLLNLKSDYCYIYDQDTIQTNLRVLKNLKSINRINYAMKANDNPNILKMIHAEGLSFDCVSFAEIEHLQNVLGNEFQASKIVFTPNFAPIDEYKKALQHGCTVTVDNLDLLQQAPEVFANQSLHIRLDPGKGRGHHPHVETGGTHSKFGIAKEHILELKTAAADLKIKIDGLHAHVGSGIFDPQSWQKTALFLADIAPNFPDVEAFNLGGGFGVRDRLNGETMDFHLWDHLMQDVRNMLPKDLQLWIEPGRFVVSECGVILCRVTQIKHKGQHTFVGLNTGMNSLIRPALYGAYHEAINLTRLEEPHDTEVDLVGPICESGDVFGRSRKFPKTFPGDVVLILNAGAYGRVMSSTYNLRQPGEEIFC